MSLGQKVPVDWVAKEVWLRTKLDYDLKVFTIDENYLILHFWLKRDYAAVLKGGP